MILTPEVLADAVERNRHTWLRQAMRGGASYTLAEDIVQRAVEKVLTGRIMGQDIQDIDKFMSRAVFFALKHVRRGEYHRMVVPVNENMLQTPDPCSTHLNSAIEAEEMLEMLPPGIRRVAIRRLKGESWRTISRRDRKDFYEGRAQMAKILGVVPPADATDAQP